ncbi:MAG: sigma-70 family RNA polymerase sigma factor [Phaeodactylibacter sp.]|nr:sigma-70 family RNA polymerase sigma factor [Phaeodactylibacter sp.]
MDSNDTVMTQFVTLLAEHEHYFASYVKALIPNSADADDVLQEVKVALWKHFAQFKLGTDFAAWGKQVAYYRILSYRKKNSRDRSRLVFSDASLDALSETHTKTNDAVGEEVSKLGKCLSRLKPRLKNMLALRYNEEFKVEEVAMKLNMSVEACYKAIARARLQLRNCMTKR